MTQSGKVLRPSPLSEASAWADVMLVAIAKTPVSLYAIVCSFFLSVKNEKLFVFLLSYS